MIKTEVKIFAREPMAVFWGLVFPSLLLLVLGLAFPGAQDPSPDLGGARLVDLYTPIVLGLALITLGVNTLPMVLSLYRERGILRRLATTPVSPSRMVVSQLAVHGVIAVLSSMAAIALGWIVFDVAFPDNLAGLVVAFVMGTLALFAIGLFIGAIAPTASSGQGIAMGAYFPLLFFAGVYFPREVMPEGLLAVSDFTPSGALVEAFADVWAGGMPSLASIGVMAAYAVIFGLAAILLFRWE